MTVSVRTAPNSGRRRQRRAGPRRLDLQEKHLLHHNSRIPLLHGVTNDNFRRLPQGTKVLCTNLMARCKQPATPPGEQSTPTLTDNGRF